MIEKDGVGYYESGPTYGELLADPRLNKSCAFCKYFELEKSHKAYIEHGYGQCNVPEELVKVPVSYRAENEGTSAIYGQNCTFFERGRDVIPQDWPFLKNLSGELTAAKVLDED